MHLRLAADGLVPVGRILCDPHVAGDRNPHRIERHIAPAIGMRKAINVSRSDIVKLHRAVGKEHPVTANRLVTLLNAVYAHGARAGILPVRFAKSSEGHRQIQGDAPRALSVDSGAWRALAKPSARLRPKAFRGRRPTCRSPRRSTRPSAREPPHENRTPCGSGAAAVVVHGRTSSRNSPFEVGARRFGTRSSLPARTRRPARRPSCSAPQRLPSWTNLPRVGTYVIAGDDPEKPRADLKRPWELVSKRAGLEGVRLHDLRHSFASVGAGSGMGLPLLGKLLGHSQAATTQRYAHLAADPLRRAANTISDTIAAAMGER